MEHTASVDGIKVGDRVRYRYDPKDEPTTGTVLGAAKYHCLSVPLCNLTQFEIDWDWREGDGWRPADTYMAANLEAIKGCVIKPTSLGGGVICVECGDDCECVVCLA